MNIQINLIKRDGGTGPVKSQQPPIVWKGAKSSKTFVLEDKEELIRMKSLLLEDFFYFSMISSLIEEVPKQ